MRFDAAAGIWYLDDGQGGFHQFAVAPPIPIRVDGLSVTVLVKLRNDLVPWSGYTRVVEFLF